MRAFAEEGGLSDDCQIPPLTEAVASIEQLIRTQTVLESKDGQKVVGLARCIVDGSMCPLRGVFVDPSYQGQGIGADLDDALEKMHPSGERFELTTNTFAPGNVAFYQRRGDQRGVLTPCGEQIVLAQMSKCRGVLSGHFPRRQ